MSLEELHGNLQIMSLNALTKTTLCMLGHKIAHKHLPTPLLTMFNSYGGGKTHHYPTHNRNTPNIQKHQAALFNRSFYAKALWNMGNF